VKIAVLADIHANIFALEGVIEDLLRNNCKAVYVLGDMIGYYYWPERVLQTLQDLAQNTPVEHCHFIKGNHEVLLDKAQQDDNVRQTYLKKYGHGLEHCFSKLSNTQRDWLTKLPTSNFLTIDNLKIALFHGSDQNVEEYIYPDCTPDRIEHIGNGQDFVFLGHTHYPVVFQNNGCLIANPGSVGQPRDIGGLASYMILNTQTKSLAHRRVPFSTTSVIKSAKQYDPNLPYLRDIMTRNRPK